jgi:hypothetical protein
MRHERCDSPPMIWKVDWAEIGCDEDIEKLECEGWEPFAAEFGKIWFRRREIVCQPPPRRCEHCGR